MKPVNGELFTDYFFTSRLLNLQRLLGIQHNLRSRRHGRCRMLPAPVMFFSTDFGLPE